MDAKRLLAEQEKPKPPRKVRTTMYLDGDLLNEFKKLVGERGASPMVDRMIREFVESVRGKGK